MPDDLLHLGVALDGAGWHPAAWRESGARPRELFTPRYWSDLVGRAEAGLLDLVTIEDALRLQPDDPDDPDGPGVRPDRVRGRLDAVQIAARVAPLTRHVGLVPTAVVTHTEPFHLSKAIATLDYVSGGRAGVRVQVDPSAATAGHVGRRDPAALALVDDLLEEAADYVEVLRRLWDSWEDDAEIRDVATGRFIDRERLHYIDFEGREFSVKGPSITPRPPQGQPIVAALAHTEPVFRLAEQAVDLAFVTPRDTSGAAQAAARLRHVPHVWGDLLVVLDDDTATAEARLRRLDEAAGTSHASDARVVAGTAADL
ncbi:MAG: LLM class flavin-dependent oxidoreductase, partial [Nocardioides sp.]|uniref:LLM class flavin-dependent oxidoreductase n=1 Tax=Nocardioides sp. TaxID=35761 RepID=UPI0039E667E5